jgi:hypothetical protein
MKTNKDMPIAVGTKILFRSKVGYVMECINPDKHWKHQFRYYVDSAGIRWSLSEEEVLENTTKIVVATT